MTKRIKASVSPQALSKASRFFNMSLDDILNELLQNARRANATHVNIILKGSSITVQDDGVGIASPENLLCFGSSGWDEETVTLEDAAGMGFWSLSQRGCVVKSFAKGHDLGWMTTITKEVFAGKHTASICPLIYDKMGTSISFEHTALNEKSVIAILERNAKYFPLPINVIAQDEVTAVLGKSDFLGECVHKKTIKDGVIGVKTQTTLGAKPTINFHGLTARANNPSIKQVMIGSSYEALFDFQRADSIKLVLPARKEIMRTPEWTQACNDGYSAIFEHISSLGRHTLSYKDHQHAMALGYKLPAATAHLKPWLPPCAECYLEPHDYEGPLPVTDADCVLDFDLEARDAHLLHTAIENSDIDVRLMEPCQSYEGYDWYDRLPKVTDLTFVAEKDGSTLRFTRDCDLEQFEGVLNDGKVCKLDPLIVEHFQYPDAIYAEITIRSGDKYSKRQYPLDFMFLGDGYSPEEVTILVETSAYEAQSIEPDHLADLLTYSFFVSNDSSESGTWDSQLKNFEIASRAYALSILRSDEEGDKAYVIDHVIEHVLWRCPTDRRTIIEIDKGSINVEFSESISS